MSTPLQRPNVILIFMDDVAHWTLPDPRFA
jgi:hypothetical protein